jgi:ubiquinone/menaquinone biosynthesis C-methylase UbiE
LSGPSTAQMNYETERARQIWDRQAPRFDRMMSFWEKVLFAGGREWACGQARGDVLEIAVGSGRNFPYYPPGIRLTAIELSPAMLELARARAGELGLEVDLRLGDAQALDFPGESFDTVICTCSLCSIPHHDLAVAEAKRVLRPGGRLVLMEHVRSPALPVRAGQRILNPLTERFEGDHLLREPLEHVRAEGLAIDHFERSKWGIVERLAAHKPVA